MMKAAICDDDRRQAKITRALIGKYNSMHPERGETRFKPYIFDSAEQLLESLKGGSEFDLYLLEILLPGMDGLELAHKIREHNDDVPIVFVTRSLSDIHTYNAFSVRAVTYFRKPLDEHNDRDRFCEALDRVIMVINKLVIH